MAITASSPDAFFDGEDFAPAINASYSIPARVLAVRP